MRLFLRPHGAGFARSGVEQTRLLLDPAARLDDVDLAPRLIFDGLLHEAHRIDVLDLATRAERFTRPSYRDVNVGAHGALFHVAVASAEVAQNGAQFTQISGGLLRRAEVRATDNLHQRHTRTVQIDIGIVWMLIVQALAGVLLQMQPLDTDLHRFAAGHIDEDFALPDRRLFVLRNLITGGQVRIEIVLPVEHRVQIDLGFEAQSGTHRLLDAAAAY